MTQPDPSSLTAGLAVMGTAAPGHGLTGLTGTFADLISAIGAVGVGFLTFVETVIPPIPSEIVLTLAGFVAHQGEMSLVLAVVAATIGSVAGALVLYGMGAWFGEERATALLAQVPLVDREDLVAASRWFHRHGPAIVFLGRFLPVVRSLVSLPAGAQRMPLRTFVVLTACGSGLWNLALIGAGWAVGTQYHLIADYTRWLDYLVVGGLVVLAAWYVLRRVRRHRATS